MFVSGLTCFDTLSRLLFETRDEALCEQLVSIFKAHKNRLEGRSIFVNKQNCYDQDRPSNFVFNIVQHSLYSP